MRLSWPAAVVCRRLGKNSEEDTAIDLIIGNNKKKDLMDILENFLAEREGWWKTIRRGV